MKRVKLITTTLFVILAICVTISNAKDNPNIISFDNQSGESALVKLVGPTPKIVKVANGQKRSVNVAAGEYYILVRYGKSPERYRYSKGDTFTVHQTSTQYSTITITLHKVIGGSYATHPTSSHEFNKAIATDQITKPNKAVVFSVQKKLKELGHNPGPIDGIWGKKTEASLKAFQKKNNLPITGYLDKKTKETLLLTEHKKIARKINPGNTQLSSLNPWQSLFITGGSAPSGITINGKVMELSVDLGKELATEEIKILKNKVKLVDKSGQEYRPSGYGSAKGFRAWSRDRITGRKISWHADFAIFFKFVVPSQSSTYTLYWKDFPPLVIGNPFATPFIRIERKSGDKREVEVSADGYEAKKLWVPLDAREDKTLDIRLKEIPARAGHDGTWKDPTTGMEFVWVPGDCFQMGSPSGESGRYSNEGPVHEVCVDGFWMGKFEVTNAQYRKFKSGHNSKKYERHSLDGETQPTVFVSWKDAKVFAQWLSRQNGGRYEFRLPTEAEWEYAARAGSTTARYWGDDPDDACGYANVHDRTSKGACSNFTWTTNHNCDDGYAVTAPVGRFKANGFGLHDMLGNVWELCEDRYLPAAYSIHSRSNPMVLSGGMFRVARGGSWNSEPRLVRSAPRFILGFGDRVNFLGFRLLRNP